MSVVEIAESTVSPLPIPDSVDDALAHLAQTSLQIALAHHRGGRLEQARAMYQAVLALQPDHPNANHNLGTLAVQTGQAALALPYFRQALASNRGNWQYWISWVDALIHAGQVPAAAKLLEQARRAGLAQASVDELVGRMVELPWLSDQTEGQVLPGRDAAGDASAPSAPEIIHITTLLNQNQFAAVEAYARGLVANYPANGLGWKMLGIALNHMGNTDAACECQRKVVEICPDDADSWDILGLPSIKKGELVEAEICFRRALRVNPLLTSALSNLGLVLQRQTRLAEAERCFQRCVEIDPAFHVAYLNLSVVLGELGQTSRAEVMIRRALTIKPDFAQAHGILGSLLKDQGRLVEAEAATRRAIQLNPSDIPAYANLLFLLNYDPDKSAEEIFEAYQEFDAQHGLPYKPLWQAHQNSYDGQRRLRVGYVCATFGRHSTRHFLEPLLAQHDHRRLEVFAYSELPTVEDEVTARYRSYMDHWVHTVGMDDDTLAQRIRDDGIDVLVDVSGQTRDNRLGAFARKPAPVSLHWLDFGYTTGLSAIDYYLTDELTVPLGSEHLFAETPWRLPVPALVYRPPTDTGPVSTLPCQQRGYVTFGTLTRSIRINHRTLHAWAEVLRRVPGSRLVINSSNFKDQAAQAGLTDRLVALGLDPDRLDIGFHSPPWDVLRGIDIGLDCFPHNSGTTLLESLYMGVPYVTLVGRPSVGRLGAAVLQGAGHPELIAVTEAEYVDKLVALAQDPARLGRLRARLRCDLEASPLMDEAGFARQVEATYHTMFARWLSSGDQTVNLLATAPQNAPAAEDVLKQELLESMELALAQHRAGQLDVAEEMYRVILQCVPAHPDANHNLAVIALETGHAAASLPYFKKAFDAEPGNWQYWLSFFDAVLQAGQCAQAIEMLELRRRQGLASDVLTELVMRAVNALYLAHTQRANQTAASALAKGKSGKKAAPGKLVPPAEVRRVEALFNQDKLSEVVTAARAITLRYPKDAFGWKALGAALINQELVSEALGPLRKAVEIAPLDVGALSNLGFGLLSQNHPIEGEVNLRLALRLNPDFASALINLGANLLVQDRFDEAGELFQKGLAIEPGYGPAHNHMGRVLDEQGRLVESARSFEKAREVLKTLPAHVRMVRIHLAQAHQSLCMGYAKLAVHDQVIAHADAAMAVLPDDAELWERRLYALSYHPDLTAGQIFSEFVRWGDRFPAPTTDFSNHDKTPGRRLKVGYVSPDFRRHTSRFYFWPFFANHDHSKVELFAYSNVKLDDDFTQKFKSVFDHWCDIRELSDAEVAARVQADGIDILVDGCNHMRDERLGVFSLKPAPVQVTWLGAAWTTGLKAVDYVLFDPYIAPPETVARENIVRLPHCFVPFESMTETEEPQPPPCLKNGFVTFGYSGRTERLNQHTFRVWAEILRQMPTSRLVLDFRYFADPPTQVHFRELMQKHGVDTGRVDMRCSANIFKGLHDFDILLDCFPHSGGTMLVDALWMGVPALTLAGRPPLGRIGTTFVMNLGLPEWVTYSEQEYIAKACAMGRDVAGRTELRAGMRKRMLNSPLMDGKGFARGVEWAYDAMWTRYCQGEAASPLTVPLLLS
jgi:predicted O-linked N-acetylglucosamine transferase (SPINDLY family)